MPFSIKALYSALRQSGSDGDGIFYSLTQGNRIEAILDTPQLWGHNPAVFDYVPAAGNLRDAITSLISTATKTVDISVLFPFPYGLFLDAIQTGLAKVDPRIQVRITAGFYFPIPPAQVDPVGLIDQFIRDLALRPQTRLHVAAMQTWATSWNHSKLIIVDGQRAISGGHNQWSDDYTQFAPVHDVSFQFSGPAAKTGENFINAIWTRKWYDTAVPRSETPPLFWSRASFDGQIGPSPLIIFDNPSSTTGQTAMLAVGRAGINLEPLFPLVSSDNASLLARTLAVSMADKDHILMSQQMLGGSPLGEYDAQFFPALCDHIIRGGRLSLIISDTGATTMTHDSYSGDGIEATAQHFARTIRSIRPDLSKSQLVELLREGLHIGPTRIYDRQPGDPEAKSWLWRNGSEALEPANHAKIMIFGDAGFYIGSDNAYAMPFNPFGMQEFGHLVEGIAETRLLIDQYWAKAWTYSAQFEVKDWERIVDEAEAMHEPARQIHPS